MTLRRNHQKPHKVKRRTVLSPGYIEQEIEDSPPVKYIFVTSVNYTIQEADLIVGSTIYGVDAGANATINLPVISDSTKIVEIVNESDIYNLTINEL